MKNVFGSGVLRARFLCALFSVGFLCSGSNAGAGEAFDLSVYRDKVVIVDFWASWCVPCRRSFPWLNDMQKKYGDDGLVVVGVNMDARLTTHRHSCVIIPQVSKSYSTRMECSHGNSMSLPCPVHTWLTAKVKS